ncbi:MAG: hypothetical protein GY707_03210, partial [Desulfobacteraceae bacterium]|nr:hypothetical protein [Desulfobacteraceae bacterium]
KISNVTANGRNLRPKVANLIFQSHFLTISGQISVTKNIFVELVFLIAMFGYKLRPLAATSQNSIEVRYCSQVFEVSNAANRFRIGAIFPEILLFKDDGSFFSKRRKYFFFVLSLAVLFNAA